MNDLQKLLLAMAEGTDHIANGHDVIFKAAAASLSSKDAEIAAAVAAEREACAKLIEDQMLCDDTDGSEVLMPRTNPGNKVGFAYAAAIRARAALKEGE